MAKKKVVNLYTLVPEQKRPFEERGDGTIDVLLPRYGNNRVGRLVGSIFNKRPVRIQLDDIGASVWRLCDGRRTVRDIGTSLQQEFGDRIEPVYERLEVFLKQMSNAGIITLKQ